ncbi:TonB-dependent hemoglobin/transferrin/lactoferrin family receptor [Thauera sinica]|uniref:TonB-dependent hemoglobin/transferrin/lactoferrin family receptor n=1 Tax=Thauera sinica TaxID=2665146 RepID=A0ABW1AUK5_9RHOO|nr:TonB-dependent hemoglobin/transferrin/lactoferrin family receptor [Thauera sp. K11]ATE61907.1 TonB-dependent receptor [Thauera sp. K11]
MLRLIALAAGVALGPIFSASAQEAPGDEAVRLKEVSVTSTRTERRLDNIPNTVTVTPRQRIEEEGARDIKDLFRDELDVSVRAAPTRFTAAGAATGRAGNEGINIRGLEGNQVLMLIDGIRVPNSFSFASFSTGRGDFLEVDGLQRVEVLRGPASIQFGSDGLAGAVSFRTMDPADLLKKDQAVGGFVRAGYASVDRSWASTLGLAGRDGRWQGMLLGTFRQGHEVDSHGGNDARNVDRTAPNPVDYRNGYLLGKAMFAVDAENQLGFTVERQRRRQDTEVYSARAKPPLAGTGVLDLDTDDRIERDRVSLEHRFTDVNANWVQRAETRFYWQDAEVRQFSDEDRNTAADRTRDNAYSSKIVGLSTLLESNLTGALNQRVTYGLDWSRAEISAVRDGTVAPFGETFPVKPFPDTTYTLLGAFVQSEIEAGAFSIIPGLRFDQYKLDPSAGGYGGGAVSDLSDRALTPRLGVVWRLMPAFAPYAQWARGFRAPTPDQVNNGFTNAASGYTSVGNPDLKAERANSAEIGFRGEAGGVRYSVAAFDNRYDDFISQQRVGGAGTVLDPTVFQYINLAKARIRGAEVRGEWTISPRWKASAGLAYARGDSETDGRRTPLDTVAPLKAILGVRYDDASWGARAHLTHTAKKDADRIAPADPAPFSPPSSTVLDLGVHWKPLRNLTVYANLDNVFDKRYWRWSDVRGLADTSPVRDAYTAPGRNFRASLRYDF